MAHATSPDRIDRDHGRDARKPEDIPAPGWKDIIWRVVRQMGKDRLSIIAPGVAFYGLLAVFPALITLVAIYGLAFDPRQVEQQVAGVSALLPPQAAEVLLSQLSDLTSRDNRALSFGAVVALLLALWSASLGVRTLMEALNVAYGEEEKRGFIRFYATGLMLTLLAIIGTVLAIAMLVALPIVLRFLGLSDELNWLLSIAVWPVLIVMMMTGLAVMYRYGPSRRRARWRWTSWGAVIATTLWLIASLLFTLYVRFFDNFNETYGSVGAIAVLMLWFLLSAYAVLIGAEFNAEMERQTRQDTTTAPDEPLGQRGAYAADTVGEAKPAKDS